MTAVDTVLNSFLAALTHIGLIDMQRNDVGKDKTREVLGEKKEDISEGVREGSQK